MFTDKNIIYVSQYAKKIGISKHVLSVLVSEEATWGKEKYVTL